MSAPPLKLHYDYHEAADALGVEHTFLRRRIKKLPHRKPDEHSQYVLFTEADLREISESWAQRPDTQAAPTSIPAALLELRPRRATRSS